MDKMIKERYLLVRKIGEGGMADVYLAMDTVLNREVALKILRGDLSSDPVALLRFQREANAASNINHDNVVGIYDVGEDQNNHYIVMEYIRGKTLKQLIIQRGALEKEEAVNIMKQLVMAVSEAHDNEIIHRDIKPQNIMIKDDGTVKITDFGIAMAADALQLTQSDSVMGSVHYLAPECARGENATKQSDIYSLGIVFYEMLTGEVPHRGEAPIQIAMKHMKEEIPSVLSINPMLPVSIDNIIKRATAKNRINRYPDTHIFFEDLNVCLNEAHAHDEPVEFEDNNDDENEKTMLFDPTGSITKDKKKKRDTGKIVLISFIVIALIFASVMIYQLTRPKAAIIYTVPELVGKSETDASASLLDSGFNILVRYGTSDDYEKGLVYQTIPVSGTTKADKGFTVIVYISQGKSFVVGNYVGQDFTSVKEMLDGLASNNIRILVDPTYIPTSEYKPGTIISQKLLLEGDEVTPNNQKTIIFEVAQNISFIVPPLINSSIDSAYNALVERGAVVEKEVLSTAGMSDEEAALLQKGVVVEMSVEVGSTYEQTEDSKIILRYYE